MIIKIMLCILFFINTTYAMRCGNDIVQEGDSQFSVKTKCGEPLDKETYQQTTPQYNEYGYKMGDATSTIDKWIYQKSPADFQYELIFDEGVLKTITANRNP